MRPGYSILRWAVRCGKGVTANNGIIFNAYWQQANGVTQNGAYFPPEGSAAYADARDGVNFPSYFAAGSTTDVWRGPEDPAVFARIDAQDCGVEIPAKYVDATFCPSGCYAPNQYVLFADDAAAAGTAAASPTWLPVGEAFDVKRHVVTLAADAALDELKFGVSEIAYFIADPKPARQALLKLTMASGGALTVTTNHPVLNDLGYMKRARELRIGDKLVRQDGAADPVVAIEPVEYFGRVYNLDTKDADPLKKILLANGYLNGSHWYQDLGQSMLNRLLLRASAASRLEE